jgi:DNA-binding NarL/FixJ family response regulator
MSVCLLVVDDEPDVAALFRPPRARRLWIGSRNKFSPRLWRFSRTSTCRGMDGLQLLGEIKQRCPDLPVLMVTAYGDDERRRHARGLGAFDFVTKPVDFDHLKAQLRQLPGAAH